MTAINTYKRQVLVIVNVGICIFMLSNCQHKKEKEKGILFPNDDSELTLLMRNMYSHFDSLKIAIEKGEDFSVKTFDEIHHAVSTEPEKAESDLYKAMASVYSSSVESLKNNKMDRQSKFNTVVDNCMNCHQHLCPGPMVKIKKLYAGTN